MFLVVIEKKSTSPYIEVVEHTVDFIQTGKPWYILVPCDTIEEAKKALDVFNARKDTK